MSVETSVLGITAPFAVYEIGGRRFEIDEPGFAEAVADAHIAHHRPRCLCRRSGDGQGVEMYVARLAGTTGGYIVKRMPDTGSQHAPDCPSYEPPAEFSGLGQVLGSAITEDPATGETTLKLDFPLTKMPGRSQMPTPGGDRDSVTSDGTRLSLRGLLHYLWDQAELTRWHPGFAGKRTWATVRRHLLQAAEHKLARGQALLSKLYIPEAFSVDQRDALTARRLAQWSQATAEAGKPQQLMLLIGEVKEIVPARYGYKAVVKHLPDQAFAVDEQLYRRLVRRFGAELALWGACDALHMVMVASFGVNEAGMPTIVELSLMPVSGQWLPIEDAFELQLVEHLVRERRCFVKGLRYNLAPGQALASAVLTDTAESPVPLFIARTGARGEHSDWGSHNPTAVDSATAWIWHVAGGAMPPLPNPCLWTAMAQRAHVHAR